MSANVGYIYTSEAKGTFGGSDFVMLDRPDEFNAALALDFPVNRYFQPILEIRGTRYVGGRTPNWASPNLDKVDHIVVLMMENRSFDHLLGARAATSPEVDGLTPAVLQQFNAPGHTIRSLAQKAKA